MKCLSCQKEFESKRKDARYCSAYCRVKASRSDDTDKNDTDKNDTDNQLSVATDKTPKSKLLITEADEWRREYLEDNAEFFTQQLEDTKDCPVCNDVRATYGSKSLYKFCSVHLRIPRLAS